MKIAARFRELRKHTNVTLQELANVLSRSRSTVQSYVDGKTPLLAAQLEKIAEAMHIDVKHLHEEPGAPLPEISIRPRRPAARRWPARRPMPEPSDDE